MITVKEIDKKTADLIQGLTNEQYKSLLERKHKEFREAENTKKMIEAHNKIEHLKKIATDEQKMYCMGFTHDGEYIRINLNECVEYQNLKLICENLIDPTQTELKTFLNNEDVEGKYKKSKIENTPINYQEQDKELMEALMQMHEDIKD